MRGEGSAAAFGAAAQVVQAAALRRGPDSDAVVAHLEGEPVRDGGTVDLGGAGPGVWVLM
ncbi:hypothetical protein [Pseudonocardia sp. NPDC049154]|uniref:hypothetical protein n=1 Tax=Pseudonocardia sp. NPDC049154 TaxID=3155501 RepID=UPI0033C4C880